MKTIKKRISKLYKNLGRFARKFIAPALSFLLGGAFFFYIGKFAHGYVLSKTSSNIWAWIIAIVVVVLLIVLGAANDSTNAKVDNERNAQKNLTQHHAEPTAPPPFTAGNAEYQYMRVPKF